MFADVMLRAQSGASQDRARTRLRSRTRGCPFCSSAVWNCCKCATIRADACDWGMAYRRLRPWGCVCLGQRRVQRRLYEASAGENGLEQRSVRPRVRSKKWGRMRGVRTSRVKKLVDVQAA
eukprot:1835309-Pleurochrysis_carterae.AAC.4